MNPKLSIIVPVYNVEKYLEKCIISILEQTFEDFELILINDGSTDNCGAICDDFAKQDNRIKVIHKENGGQSSARNIGINIARGEYIGFVDSDDYIMPTMYEKLYKGCQKNNADISIAGWTTVNEYGDMINKYQISKVSFLSFMIKAYPWNKLYKKKLFIENDFYFKEGMIYEDVELIPKLYTKANKVILIDSAEYNYLKRSNSTTALIDHKIFDIFYAYESLRNYLINENLWTKYGEEYNIAAEIYKNHFLDRLYDCSSIFLIKNMKLIKNSMDELGGVKNRVYLRLFIRHINISIKRNIKKIIKNKL